MKQLAAMGQVQLANDIRALAEGFDVYSKDFSAMVELQHKLGLSPEKGLEGALRDAAIGWIAGSVPARNL